MGSEGAVGISSNPITLLLLGYSNPASIIDSITECPTSLLSVDWRMNPFLERVSMVVFIWELFHKKDPCLCGVNSAGCNVLSKMLRVLESRGNSSTYKRVNKIPGRGINDQLLH